MSILEHCYREDYEFKTQFERLEMDMEMCNILFIQL